MRLGIVQTTAQTADFSRNLRALVQGYRSCIDQGATLVVADSFSLSGPCPLDFKERSSFLHQTQAALQALSEEIGAVPLLLGAFAPAAGLDGNDDFWDEEGFLPETAPEDEDRDEVVLMPHLIEEGTVSVVEDELIRLDSGLKVYTVCREEIDAFGFDADVLVVLPHEPWYVGAQSEREDKRSWEARQEGKPIVCVCPAGASDGNIWGGGSTMHTADGRLIARLPLFAAASQIVDTERTAEVRALPDAAAMLHQALVAGLGDHVRRNGYEGVSLVWDGRPHSLLLARLASETLGAERVTLLSCEEPAAPVAEWLENTGLTNGWKRLSQADLSEPADASLLRRLLTARAAHEAEKEGSMLLSSLTRSDLLSGTRLEETQGTLLLPLGDLYEGDLRLLAAEMSTGGMPALPAFADTHDGAYDRAFQLIEDGNRSATELLANPECPLDEATVRKAQRLLIASAWKRRCLPPVLEMTCMSKRRRYPAMHRLND